MEDTVRVEIELFCPDCLSRFSASPHTPADEIIDRMRDEGPWYALANGETFEDMIFSALLYRGAIRCPDCSEPVLIREKTLGRLLDVLAGAFWRRKDAVMRRLLRPSRRASLVRGQCR
jgi:hypothetical protein